MSPNRSGICTRQYPGCFCAEHIGPQPRAGNLRGARHRAAAARRLTHRQRPQLQRRAGRPGAARPVPSRTVRESASRPIFSSEEPQPGPVPVLAVAVLVEDPLDGLGHVVDFAGGDERLEQLAHAAVRPHAPAHVNREALLAVAHLGDQAQVVDRGRRTVAPAAGEGDLVLPRKLVRKRIGQQELGQRQHVGRRIEHLVGADAGILAAADVAHRIAAAAPGGHARLVQIGQRRRDVADQHAMDLDVLPRGHVQHAVAVGSRHGGQHAHLVRQHAAGRKPHAEHVGVGLALLVHAHRHAERRGTRRPRCVRRVNSSTCRWNSAASCAKISGSWRIVCTAYPRCR